MSETYEIYASKKMAALAMLFFGAVCAYAFHIVINKAPEPVTSVKWSFIFDNTHQAMITVLVLLVPMLFLSLKALINSHPIITIDAEGIVDTRHFKHPIPWNNIVRSGQDTMKFGRQKMYVLGLELTDYGKKDTHFTLFYHLNAWAYKSKNPNVVIFHLNGLAYDSEDLARVLQSYNYARPQLMSRQPVSTRRKIFN